jgi:hypothetical protein
MKRASLKDWPWETVVTINAALRQERKALHKPTSDGYEPAWKLWGKSRNRELDLREVFQICRRCYRLAPFCFYNGNTFVAVGRTLIQDLLRKMPPVQAHAFRSVVGHYIAGTVGDTKLNAVLEKTD